MSVTKRIENIESQITARSAPAGSELDGISYLELLRLTAVVYQQSPAEPVNLDALNPDERTYWDELWKSKPDPAGWDARECCMFDFLHREATGYEKPWPHNHRIDGLKRTEWAITNGLRQIECERPQQNQLQQSE